MQNVQKYRDANYHHYYQYSNQMHLNQNNYNMYSTNQVYNSQLASRQVQLSPSVSVPTSVSPISGYFPAINDIYYQNNLAITCQNLTTPITNNESNPNSHIHTQILNHNNYINIQNNCNKVCNLLIVLFI